MSVWIRLRELGRSLKSDLCPACAGAKKERQTLCRSCYWKLSRPQRDALYNPVGVGYEEAFDAAMKSLGVTDPHFPQPAEEA